MSQSSNDTFVTAMHIAAYQMTTRLTLPALEGCNRPRRQVRPVDVGRQRLARTTSGCDTAGTVGQEWSGYAAALPMRSISWSTRPRLVAAGDGRDRSRNWPQRAARFDVEVAAVITELTGDPS